jgi:hypothetical protein
MSKPRGPRLPSQPRKSGPPEHLTAPVVHVAPHIRLSPAFVELSPAARAAAVTLAVVVDQVAEGQAEMTRLVAQLRAAGATWSHVAYLTGLTAEGSRRKWGGGSIAAD